jgi:hypothetical protein
MEAGKYNLEYFYLTIFIPLFSMYYDFIQFFIPLWHGAQTTNGTFSDLMLSGNKPGNTGTEPETINKK